MGGLPRPGAAFLKPDEMLGAQNTSTLVGTCRSNAVERDLLDAIGEYLHAHVERHGHARTAAAFGVSRHTLWRFLEHGQPDRALPRAVTGKAGDSPAKLAAATRALGGAARPVPERRTPRLTQALHETLLPRLRDAERARPFRLGSLATGELAYAALGVAWRLHNRYRSSCLTEVHV